MSNLKLTDLCSGFVPVCTARCACGRLTTWPCKTIDFGVGEGFCPYLSGYSCYHGGFGAERKSLANPGSGWGLVGQVHGSGSGDGDGWRRGRPQVGAAGKSRNQGCTPPLQW